MIRVFSASLSPKLTTSVVCCCYCFFFYFQTIENYLVWGWWVRRKDCLQPLREVWELLCFLSCAVQMN